MNNKIKISLKLFIVLMLCIFVGYALLSLAYMLPIKYIEKNVSSSSVIFTKEGTYPEIIKGYCDTRLDNWTDALMLLTAAHESELPFYQNAALNASVVSLDMTPAEVLSALYGDEKPENVYIENYGRYWHGYLIFLKPLHLFFFL